MRNEMPDAATGDDAFSTRGCGVNAQKGHRARPIAGIFRFSSQPACASTTIARARQYHFRRFMRSSLGNE